MKHLLAVSEINFNRQLEGEGTLALPSRISNAFSSLNNVLTVVVGVLSIIAAIFFLFVVMSGAYNYLSAGADKAKLEDARQKILNGIVGFIMVIAAVFLADLIGYFIGIDFLNPGAVLELLGP